MFMMAAVSFFLVALAGLAIAFRIWSLDFLTFLLGVVGTFLRVADPILLTGDFIVGDVAVN